MSSSENIQQLKDEELVERFREGDDNKYLGVLFKRYTNMVFGVCMKYLKDEDESKDAVMQIFEKLLTDLKKHKVEYFKAWLHTVAKYHCLMKLRSKPKEISGMDPYIMEIEGALHPEQDSVDEPLEKEKKLVSMEKALEKLDPHQQTCIRLFYLEQKCYQEVASITGFNLNQVKSYIQNGKRNLKIIMSKND